MSAEVSNRTRSFAPVDERADATLEVVPLKPAEIVRNTTAVPAPDKLKAGDFDAVDIEKTAEEESAVFLARIEMWVSELLRQTFDNVEGETDGKRIYLPAVQGSFRHV